jgi:hypothetical protein
MSQPPTLLILFGIPGCGKLTIANALQQRLPSFKLFHNHLVLDTLLALFPYGSPSFVKHRDRMWLELIPEAIHNGDSLIFTFVPDNTISRDFLPQLIQRIEGTPVVDEQEPTTKQCKCFVVEIQCKMDELLRRIPNESRKSFHKICDLSHFQQILDHGELTIASDTKEDSERGKYFEGAHLVVDATETSPEENAQKIYDALLLLR